MIIGAYESGRRRVRTSEARRADSSEFAGRGPEFVATNDVIAAAANAPRRKKKKQSYVFIKSTLLGKSAFFVGKVRSRADQSAKGQSFNFS